MSYLLDALKEADQRRSAESATESDNQLSHIHPVKPRSWWPAAALVALLMGFSLAWIGHQWLSTPPQSKVIADSAADNIVATNTETSEVLTTEAQTPETLALKSPSPESRTAAIAAPEINRPKTSPSSTSISSPETISSPKPISSSSPTPKPEPKPRAIKAPIAVVAEATPAITPTTETTNTSVASSPIEADVSTRLQTQRTVAPAQAVEPKPPAEITREAKPIAEALTETTTTVAQVAAEPSAPANTEAETAVKERPPLLRQLPLDVQQSLPKIAITVHLYTDQPSQRLIRINGKSLREGGKLTSELLLQEITAEGAIFQYQQYLFRLRAQ